MTAAPPDISVVVCAYTDERWDDLCAAVASLQSQTLPPREIVVVVDHNPELARRAAAELRDTVVVENHDQRGLGGARNSGVAAARGAVVAFLDDDAVAHPDWLAQLAAGFADANVVGVGGSTEPVWNGARPGWFPEEFYWVIGCSYRGMPSEARPVRNVHGCNMAFRREVFQSIGRFRLGYGCDETELCIRIRQRWPEKVILYQPRARVRHQVSAGRASWRYFRTRCFFEGGSKAVVAWLLGPGDGLASERSYTLQTLPRGVLRGLSDAIVGGDVAGLQRAGAIVAGLAFTTAGYLRNRLAVGEAARARGWAGL